MKEFNHKCNACLKEIGNGQSKYYFHYLDDILKLHIEEKSQPKEDYLLCQFCHRGYEIEKFKSTVETVRKTKCFICQKILLKDNETTTLYYSIIEPDPNDKEGDLEIEKPICLSCWKKNQAQYYLNNYWIEILVNPDRIMGFAFGKDRTIDLKL